MKILLIICSLCIAGTLGYTTDELTAYLQTSTAACWNNSGCLLCCISRKIKLTDGNGAFLQKEASKLVPTDSVRGTGARVNECGKLTGKDSQEREEKIFSCFVDVISNAKGY